MDSMIKCKQRSAHNHRLSLEELMDWDNDLYADATESLFLTKDRSLAQHIADFAKARMPYVDCGVMCFMVPEVLLQNVRLCSVWRWKDRMWSALAARKAGKVDLQPIMEDGFDNIEASISGMCDARTMQLEDKSRISPLTVDGKIAMGHYIRGAAWKKFSKECLGEKCWIEPVYRPILEDREEL